MKLFFKSLTRGSLLIGGFLIYLMTSELPLQGVWQPSVLVSDPNLQVDNQGGPVLVGTPIGNAISVWTYDGPVSDPNATTIASAYYQPGFGWLPSQIISSTALNTAGGPLYTFQGDPDVALHSTGYAVAVWEAIYNQAPDRPTVVVAARRSPSGVWGTVEILSDLSSDAISENINVTMNEAGTALAVWRTSYDDVTEYSSINASFSTIGGAWTTPFRLDTDETPQEDNKPHPAINPNGDAVVAWLSYSSANDGDLYSTKVSTYNAATQTWSPAITLDSVSGQNIMGSNPKVAIDNNGHAVATWENNGNIKVSYFNGISWSPALTIGIGVSDDNTLGPDVVMDPNGNATVVWSGPFPNKFIYASSRLPNGSWTTGQIISQPGTRNYFGPFQSQEPLAVNPNGDVIAIWSNEDSRDFVTAYKPFGLNWLAPEIVTTNRGLWENVALFPCGFAIALWFEEEGIEDPNRYRIVRAAVNTDFPLSPNSLNPTIRQCCANFASQKVCLNILTFTPNSCSAYYNIFKDGILFSTMLNSSENFQIIDPIGCGVNPIYTISQVSIYGTESVQIPFIIN
ncbi:MAG TPA: hypothetical protein VGP47_06365 [Parachlamydiaceae bacterium]|nr:hypothetical protein [Parachlamydiaceae bacterium]